MPDCLVSGYEDLAAGLQLPTPNVTPSSPSTFQIFLSITRKFNIEPLHPDEFVHHQFGLDNASVIVAAQRCRARLKNPPKTAEEYLASLDAQGLSKTVAELCKYRSII